MKRYVGWILIAAFFSIQMPTWAAATVPMQITYQGTLKQKGVPANGLFNMQFAIVDANGSQIASNAQLNPPPNIQVTNGLFSVQLTIPSSVNWQNVTPYLQISIGGQALNPPQAINANLYSVVSQTVVDHAITTAKLDTSVLATLSPIGSITAFAGATAPAGWQLCDGSAVSRTTNAALFAVIGTVWGTGDGVTTFNVPDLRGRAPIGAGQGATLSNRNLGQTLGEENHTLTLAELPSHSHPVNDPGHQHKSPMADGGPFGSAGPVTSALGATGTYARANSLSSSSMTGITVGNAGGGQSHNTMQPSAVVNFIIKL